MTILLLQLAGVHSILVEVLELAFSDILLMNIQKQTPRILITCEVYYWRFHEQNEIYRCYP